MIDRKGLRRLRRLLERSREAGTAFPLEELVALADVGTPTGVTIDFDAARELGHPLVVLRPKRGGFEGALQSLTSREREVAALVAQGLANKEIAVRLGIAVSTVKDHVHRILSKTGLSNRTAVASALRL